MNFEMRLDVVLPALRRGARMAAVAYGHRRGTNAPPTDRPKLRTRVLADVCSRREAGNPGTQKAAHLKLEQ
jgi:hypothetical protein